YHPGAGPFQDRPGWIRRKNADGSDSYSRKPATDHEKKVKRYKKALTGEAAESGGPYQQSAYRKLAPGEMAKAVKDAEVKVRKRIADKLAAQKAKNEK
ncbi:MAG: hypothetical protein ACR2PH_04505, partial [Desulfobulbia bacterium]